MLCILLIDPLYYFLIAYDRAQPFILFYLNVKPVYRHLINGAGRSTLTSSV